MNLHFEFFKRYLFSSRSGSVIRSIARLCWIATLVGVASLIIVQSIMSGFNKSIRRKLLMSEPHVRVMGTNAGSERVTALVDSLSAEFSIQSKANFFEQDVILRTLDGNFGGAVARGYDGNGGREYLERLYRGRFRLAGTESVPQDVGSLNPKEIAIGNELAADLRLFEGDEVLVMAPEMLLSPAEQLPQFERVRVAKLIVSDIADVDSKLIIYNRGEVPLRFESATSGISGMDLRLMNADRSEKLKGKLLDELGAEKENAYSVETWGDRNSALFFALKMEKIAMTAFLSLTILITSFSLITVLVMLISQKQKEIGLLMALGLSAERTQKLFLTIGLFLSGFGLFGGLAVGVLVSLYIEKYPLEILPEIYYDTALPSELHFDVVAGVAFGILALAVIAAYVPVRLYLNKSPAQNLRPSQG